MRATLGEDELRLHWQAGSELTSDEAVSEAEAIADVVAVETAAR